MRSDFGPVQPRVAHRVRSLRVVLLISEDDVAEVAGVPAIPAVVAVEAVAAVAADPDADPPVEAVEAVEAVVGVAAVPAVPVVPAHVRTSENNTFNYQILEENGNVLDTREGDLEDALPSALKPKASAILAALFAQAKAGIEGA